MRETVERMLEGAPELVVPTPISRMHVRTDWEALAHAMERRMPWGVCPDRDVELTVARGPWAPGGNTALDTCPRRMLVEDAAFDVSPDSIVGMVPDPCRCEGMVLDWLLLALACFCAPPGWEALHAAAAERDGQAVLIFGGSGAGKTRALEALCAAGWRCVTDDTVLAEAATRRVIGWQGNVHLRPADARRLAPEAVGQTLDQGGKVRLSPAELGWRVSASGIIGQIIALSTPEQMPDPFHTHVEMGTSWVQHAPRLLEGAEFWGRRPADLAKRVAALGAWMPVPGELAICTPFAGKAALLDAWLAAFDAAGFPEGTEVLWLANTSDEGFASRLRDAASERSGRYQVTVWMDAHRVGLKDTQVAYLWQQIRTRIPESVKQVLTLEDDVLMPDDGWQDFARVRRAHCGILGAVVAHGYSGVPSWLAWHHNIQGRGNQIAPDLWAEPASESRSDSEVSAVSFSCTLIPREAFDAATLAPGDSRFLAGGYDHQFCRESGEQVRVLWGLRCAHLRTEKGAATVLQTPADVLLVLGTGDAPCMGVGWDVQRHGMGDLGQALRGAVGGPNWALVLDDDATVPAGYVEECVEILRWHPNHALAWGKRIGGDGRLHPPAVTAALVRVDACRGMPDGRFDACRAWLCRDGWKELWLDSVACRDVQTNRKTCAQITDIRREGAPYQVLKVNRSEYRGDLPGFGGDLVQLEGYRSGLWALGIPCDRRDALPRMDFSGYRVVHLYHAHLSWSGMVAEQAHDVPLVVSAITHGRPRREECEATILRAMHVLCYTRSEAEFYAKIFPECRSKLRVVPMGVRPELYMREKACEPERRVFMAGRYCDYKNQLTCLRACAMLGLPVTFAGFADMGPEPWAYRDRLLEEAKRLDADCEVLPRLSGEDLWAQYDRAWVHVNCSRFEPFGQVTLDALALGCNIVHTRESWAAEDFGRVGSLCDPGEVESVAAAVRAELDRPRGWADSHPPTWPRAAANLLPIYEESLGKT